jgi:hypothetical protein
MKTYTKETVIDLLRQQRENCYEESRIEEFEYVNPYSDSDGNITRRINKDSIINAKSPLK